MWQALKNSECLVGGGDQVATINCFPIIVSNIIFWLLVLSAIIAVIFIIISGFKFVTSGGDAKQAEGAKKTLTFAVLGFALILLSFIILPVIAKATGVREACITRFGLSQCVPEDVSYPCSDAHPEGFCSGGRQCARDGGPDSYSCRFPCSDAHHNGYCNTGECKRIGGPDEWGCRN